MSVMAAALLPSCAATQENSGSISGTVVDPISMALPHADVIVRGLVTRTVEADEHGRFIAADLPPGTYTVRIQRTGFKAKQLDVSVQAGQDTGLGQLMLEIAPAGPCIAKPQRPKISERSFPSTGKGSVSGKAITESGWPLKHLTVALLAAGAARPVAEGNTNDSGEFEFLYITPGSYTLRVASNGPPLTKVSGLHVENGRQLVVLLTWTESVPCL